MEERTVGGPDDLEWQVLDLLVDDDESLAILHTDLVRSEIFDRHFPIAKLSSVLRRMEEREWISSWEDSDLMGRRPPSDEYWAEAESAYTEWLHRHHQGYFDEMGPWFSITPEGELEWRKRTH